MQIVQGYDSLDTAIRMLPYALSLSAAAILVTRLVGVVTPRRIVASGMVVLALGLCIVGAGIENHWASAAVLFGLIVAGLGTGAVLTLVASVLVGAAGPRRASEVGALRNTASNLGAAIGTAVAGALLIVLLTAQIEGDLAGNRILPPKLKSSLNAVEFVDNASLRNEAAKAGLSPAQVDEAVRINTDARLAALRLDFFALAALALLGAVAARGLPEQAPAA